MEQNKQQDSGEEKKAFWLIPSRHAARGILQYTYFRIDRQSEITTPASFHSEIIFVVSGGCFYEGLEVKKGDVFVYGMSKNPVTSFSTDIELFSIHISHVLLYRKFGLMPAAYHEKAMQLSQEHILSRFGRNLLEAPSEQWVDRAELFMEALLLEQGSEFQTDSFECVLRVARNLEEKGIPDDGVCCQEFGISRRHLQRQFIRFFGVTMRDYERVLRFSRAFCKITDQPLAETALLAGYYDQAHMNREFRQMAGMSPQLTAKHTIYTPLRETLKIREISGEAGE